ncbi:PilW family protein [Cocleimonas flava]|uniref:Tfp pilus assembly protein PilW n=1 Tax=Cocleimonas flava TaxID=634765 RepID=A0A4V2P891_9GAMM|nr:PilW family protein [Cocleimonas flava]TCJ84845.1 Tfp pilus assembly protein PilW [Cocleimonas flava]
MSFTLRARNNESKNAPLKKQLGLSLIELLIAMIIGLFLLAGITSSFLSSKKSSIQRDQFSLLEDNGRIALEVMSDILEHTGYASNIGAPLLNNFITGGITSRTCSGGEASVVNTGIFAGIETEDDDVNGDTIGVVYLGDDQVSRDCSGLPLPANCQISPTTDPETASIYNAFYLNNDDTLMCAGSRINEAQVIAEGVENMQILYGIDANGDKTVDRYVNATNVNGSWSDVISVQIGVLVRALKETKDEPESITYSLLDTAVVSPNDRYRRAVFSTTVNIRNTL